MISSSTKRALPVTSRVRNDWAKAFDGENDRVRTQIRAIIPNTFIPDLKIFMIFFPKITTFDG
jgi:hypothetical protein